MKFRTICGKMISKDCGDGWVETQNPLDWAKYLTTVYDNTQLVPCDPDYFAILEVMGE